MLGACLIQLGKTMTQRNLFIIAGVLLFLGVFSPLVNLGQLGSVSTLGRMGAALVVPVAFLGAGWWFALKYEDRIVCWLGAGSVAFWLYQVYLIHTKASELAAGYAMAAGVGVSWGAALLIGSGVALFAAGRAL